MKELKPGINLLLHPDNLEAMNSNTQLCMMYNKRLCDGLLVAAVNGKLKAIPELAKVLRQATWLPASLMTTLPSISWLSCTLFNNNNCPVLLDVLSCAHQVCVCHMRCQN